MGAAKHNELNMAQRIGFAMLWGFCRIVSITPRWFKFHVLRPIVVIILHISGYRRKVVDTNLRNSFPEKSSAELKRIRRAFYNTLAEVVVCTISLAGISSKNNRDLMVWEDIEEHIERNKGRDWIAMAAHYGSWEYFPLICWDDTECAFMSVYHPLKNTVFEHFYRRLRRFAPNITTVTMAEAVRHYIKTRTPERTTVLGLISDQSPVLRADTEWYRFLNQTTAFIDGSEKLAMRFHIPVYFIDIERVGYGRYRGRFIEIFDGKEDIPEGEITRRYAVELERMIRRCPELWMWSHKRWKHTPEKQARKFGIEKKCCRE